MRICLQDGAGMSIQMALTSQTKSICLDLDMVTHYPSEHIRNQSAMMNSDISCGVLRLVP